MKKKDFTVYPEIQIESGQNAINQKIFEENENFWYEISSKDLIKMLFAKELSQKKISSKKPRINIRPQVSRQMPRVGLK